jgi:NOL1/NOP2/fmu family ribosome biogenesis protein
MFRKSEVARKEWKPGLVSTCAYRQSSILEQAAQMVKPGGHLAYTTCTFSAQENEGVIATFLSRHPEFDLLQIPQKSGFQPALPEWIGLPPGHKLTRAIRIWPHLAPGEGHFIALLTKQVTSRSDSADNAGKYSVTTKGQSNSIIPKYARVLLDEFCHNNLNYQFDSSRLFLEGSYIYQRPHASPDLAGLKVIRPGWWLGTINKGRFTPSHSLALGLKISQVRNSLPLQIGESQLSAYLYGQSFSSPGEDGWFMVCVDGHPLGWGKRVKNVIKNFYPRGLRQLS